MKEDEPIEEDDQTEQKEKSHKFTPVSFHEACKERIEKKLGVTLLKQSKATFFSVDKSVRLICAVSKEHERGTQRGYWFAFHPHQRDFISEVQSSYIAFGCGDKNTIIMFPSEKFIPLLEHMNTTQKDDRFYWHVQILNNGSSFYLHAKKGFKDQNINEYLMG